MLRFVKASPNAFVPLKQDETSAGFDLSSSEFVIIPAHGKAKVSTGLKLAIPSGCYGRIAPRSGLALNHFIDVGAGVIDPGYRGIVSVLLFNFSNNNFVIQKGDRIAQLICEKVMVPELLECKNLDDTSRGEAGWGSSGK